MEALLLLLAIIFTPIYYLFIKPAKEKKEREERQAAELRRKEILRREEERRKKAEEESARIHKQKMETDYLYRAQFLAKQQREKERQEALRRQREEAERKAAEEKRQAEIKRRNELKSKYHYITLGGYNAAYRYDYYPKNRYPYLDAVNEANRRAVWNFKDGASSIGVRVLSDFLEGNYSENQMRSLTLCVIPASTASKNITRYSSMCRQICDKYSLTNGFNYIQIAYDRSDSREQKSSNTIANLSFSNSVYGRDIILFDDITTRGTSFVQVANELKKNGARSVYGVFIGRTVWE